MNEKTNNLIKIFESMNNPILKQMRKDTEDFKKSSVELRLECLMVMIENLTKRVEKLEVHRR